MNSWRPEGWPKIKIALLRKYPHAGTPELDMIFREGVEIGADAMLKALMTDER